MAVKGSKICWAAECCCSENLLSWLSPYPRHQQESEWFTYLLRYARIQITHIPQSFMTCNSDPRPCSSNRVKHIYIYICTCNDLHILTYSFVSNFLVLAFKSMLWALCWKAWPEGTSWMWLLILLFWSILGSWWWLRYDSTFLSRSASALFEWPCLSAKQKQLDAIIVFSTLFGLNGLLYVLVSMRWWMLLRRTLWLQSRPLPVS